MSDVGATSKLEKHTSERSLASGDLWLRCSRRFLLISAIIFLITGLAKIISAMGTQPVLTVPDPIFALSFHNLFIIAGSVELIIAFVCFITKSVMFKLALVFWIATVFAAYRIGLYLIGWHRPCGCLGLLSDQIGIAPQTADLLMRAVLAVLLIGSSSLILWSKTTRLPVNETAQTL